MSERRDKVFSEKSRKSMGNTLEPSKSGIDPIFFSIWEAASNGNLGMITNVFEKLLEKNLRFVQENIVGCYCAVYMAAQYGRIHVIDFLLEKSEIKNHFIKHVSDQYDTTSICPLRAAAVKGWTEIVERLVQVLVENNVQVPVDIVIERKGVSEKVASLAEKIKKLQPKPGSRSAEFPDINAATGRKPYLPSSRAREHSNHLEVPVTKFLRATVSDPPTGVRFPKIMLNSKSVPKI